jgi:hypothetical protein
MKRIMSAGQHCLNFAQKRYGCYKAQDLAFDTGDTVFIEMMKNGGWWIGFSKGRRGFFPYNYIKLLYGLIVK